MSTLECNTSDIRNRIAHLMTFMDNNDLDDLLWVIQQYATKGLNAAARKELDGHA